MDTRMLSNRPNNELHFSIVVKSVVRLRKGVGDLGGSAAFFSMSYISVEK